MKVETMFAAMFACLSAIIITGIIMYPSCERAENVPKVECIHAGGTWKYGACDMTLAPASVKP